MTDETLPKVKGKVPHGISRAMMHPISSNETESYKRLCCNSSTVIDRIGCGAGGGTGD